MNADIASRLSGIQQQLIGAWKAGAPNTSNTKGRERELVVSDYLASVLTPQYRFGSGDVVDLSGSKSGQIDIVVEFPYLPSLPVIGSTPRLYLAEGVACAIEVKSNISTQWSEVEATARKLALLKRTQSAGISMGARPPAGIPLLVIGYTGWKELATLKPKIATGLVDAVLVLDEMLFCGSAEVCHIANGGESTLSMQGPDALWAMISAIHNVVSVTTTTLNAIPTAYLVAQQ